jgi:hypothetical protein
MNNISVSSNKKLLKRKSKFENNIKLALRKARREFQIAGLFRQAEQLDDVCSIFGDYRNMLENLINNNH